MKENVGPNPRISIDDYDSLDALLNVADVYDPDFEDDCDDDWGENYDDYYGL